MNQQAIPARGRHLAEHCAELTARASHAAAPPTRFSEAAADFARAIALPLGGLIGGARLRVSCSAAAALSPEALLERVGGIAAHCVLAVPGTQAHVLAVIPLHDLLSLTDRVFGGVGETPDDLPEELPLTADLVAGQIEGLICDAFASALSHLARPEVAARAPILARLSPFAVQPDCRTFELTVSEEGRGDLTIVLAMCAESFATLFSASRKAIASPVRRDPQAGPFADIPLEVEAVVAEFNLPLARLSNLKVGDTLPLALSPEVPLKISETTFAYGSMGAADERMALQLTRVF